MPAEISEYVPQVTGVGAPRRAWWAWGAVVALAAAVCGAAVLAPVARAGGWPVLSVVLYRCFQVACHQQPERSFHAAGFPLAVCARCAGLYAGALAGLVLYPLARSLRRTDAPWRGWLLLAAVPTSADFLLGVTGLWENTHWSRLLTALPLGAVAAFYIVPGIVELSRRRGPAESGAVPARKLYQS